MTQEEQARLRAYIEQHSEPAPKGALTGAQGCRIWNRQPGFSHPTVNWRNTIWRVQRLAYVAYKGEEALAGPMSVFSACGNGRCVAAEHLKLKIRASKNQPRQPEEQEQALVLRNPDIVGGVITLPPEYEELVQMGAKNVSGTKSREVYATALRSFLRWCIANRIEKINRAAVIAYRDAAVKEHSPSTVNLRLTAIKTLAKELRFASVIDRDSLDAILDVHTVTDARRADGSKGYQKRFSVDELIKVLRLDSGKSMRQRLKARAVLHLLCFTGLRREEASSLKWKQLQVAETSGVTEGGFSRSMLVDVRTKGGHLRNVPIPQLVVDALQEWQREQACESCGVTRHACTCGRTAGEDSMFGLTESGLTSLIERASIDLGIRFRPHDLRRSFAALAARAGSSLVEIQQALGHADPKTTLRYIGDLQDYVNTPGDRVAAAAAAEAAKEKLNADQEASTTGTA